MNGRSLFGREVEVAVLDDFLDRLVDGPSTLSLEGATGTGKTALWEEAVRRAEHRGHVVLVARPAEAEASLGFGVLADVLDGVGEQVLSELPAPQRQALEVATARGAGDLDGDPLALGLAVRGVLRAVAADGPVLLAVDDVQWADASSTRALDFALRRLDAVPVGLLVTARTGARSHDELLRPEPRRRQLTVEALELGAFVRLVRERIDSPLPRGLVARVHAAADGNPLFGLELARLVADSGELADIRSLPLPESLGGVLERRLDTLDDECRTLLLAATLLARPTADVLRVAFPELRVRTLLRAATDAGVLDRTEPRLAFAHPLFRTAVQVAASPRERRRVHLRVARVLEEVEERARHRALAAARPSSALAGVLETAASQALRRGAPDAAAELLEHAARLTQPSQLDARRERLLRASDLHRDAGNLGEARAIADELVAAAPPGPVRAQALLAGAQTYEDDLARAAATATAALAECGGDAALETSVHRYLATVHQGLGDGAGQDEHVRLAVVAAERSADPRLLAIALGEQFLVALHGGDGVRTELLDRIRALGVESQLPLFSRPDQLEAAALKRTGEYARARELRRRGLTEARTAGGRADLYGFIADLADLELRAGYPRDALTLAEEALAIGEETGIDGVGAGAARASATALLELGETAAARERALAAVRLGDAAGIEVYRVSARRALGLVALAEGRAADALPDLRRYREQLRVAGMRDPSFWAEPPEIEALLALGHLEAAESLIDELAGLAQALDRPLSLAVVARYRGLLASLRSEHAAAERLFAGALRQHERVDHPLEHAATLLARATAERRVKRRGQAHQSLEHAIRLFDSVGAARRADDARAELARLGLRRSAGGELTPMERKVADTIANGATTREAAAALFLSPKTIEFHLRNVYRKLDVRSRAQLARSWAAGGEGAAPASDR